MRVAVVGDDFAPHVWQGGGACANWAKGYAAYSEKGSITEPLVSLGKNKHLNVEAGYAYLIVPTIYTWVTSTAAGSVLRVDARNNAVVAEIPVHAGPRFLAANESSVWVLSQKDGSLARIDPLTNKVAATIELGAAGEGGDISIAENYVWIAAEGVPLSQIDPRTNRVLRQFAGGKGDDALRAGFGSVWMLDELHGEVWRIDMARLEGLPSL